MRVRVWHRCPFCLMAFGASELWRAAMVNDQGLLFYEDDDEAYCGQCGEPGIIDSVERRDQRVY